MATITNSKVLAALDIPAGSKLVRIGRSWGEWAAMPERYDAATLTEQDARQDNMVRVLRASEVEAVVMQSAPKFFAAIGSDLAAVYGVGETEEAAIADAREQANDASARFSAVPMTGEAAKYVLAIGGAPSSELVVTRQRVRMLDEQ